MVDLPEDVSCSMEDLIDIVRRSGCFLTARDEAEDDISDQTVVRFVHQSAKDYIVGKASSIVFDAGILAEHRRIGQKCIQRLREPGVLHKDVRGVKRLGARRVEVDLAAIATPLSAQTTYTCSFWAEHVIASGQILCDHDSVHQFLQHYFLYWLEALGWMGRAHSAVSSLARLQSQVDQASAR